MSTLSETTCGKCGEYAELAIYYKRDYLEIESCVSEGCGWKLHRYSNGDERGEYASLESVNDLREYKGLEPLDAFGVLELEVV
jgi:hypothetical protein